MQQLSDLFVENRYFKFQDEIQFFSYYNNVTLKHRDSKSYRGCNRHFPSLASYYLHDRSLLISLCNIIFNFFCNLFKLMGSGHLTRITC